ncbi:MAG: zinc-binding dehydrogenase [Anaerolineae bacterium]
MGMKAAVVEAPGKLTVREIARPDAGGLGSYDVLCDLQYGATCTGTDQHLIAGRFPWPVQYPTLLGHESVGLAIEVGPKVRHFQVGDLISRVGAPAAPDGAYHSNWGGFAEYGLARDHWAMRADDLPPSSWRPYRVNQVIPPDVDPRAATMIITWRETLSYVTRMGIEDGAKVLIVGSGGNGLAFAAHAANAGAAAVVVIGNLSRQAAAHAAGATAYLDYQADNVDTQVADSVSGGFDFIIDSVGQADSADGVLPYLRPGGSLGIYGIDDYQGARIRSHRAPGTFTVYGGGYDEAETHHAVIEAIRDGRLDASIWLDLNHPFDLDDIHNAFQAVQHRRLIKALVRLGY